MSKVDPQIPTPLPVEGPPPTIEGLQAQLADAEAALRHMTASRDKCLAQWVAWEKLTKEQRAIHEQLLQGIREAALASGVYDGGGLPAVQGMSAWIQNIKKALNGAKPELVAEQMARMRKRVKEALAERDESRKTMRHFIGVNQQVRSERNRAMGALSLLRDLQMGRLTKDEKDPFDTDPPIPALAGED